MATLKVAVKANHTELLPTILLTKYLNQLNPSSPITATFEDAASLKGTGESLQLHQPDESIVHGQDILTYLLNFSVSEGASRETITEWIGRSNPGGTADLTTSDFSTLNRSMQELEAHLTLRSYIVAYTLSPADLVVWGLLKGNRVAVAAMKKGFINIKRWFEFVEATNPWISAAVVELNAIAQQKKAVASAGASYDIGLSHVEGGVVTRFPPEPSGYLHIGHAKAALLNDYFAHQKSDGTLICRFDDTNPTKESQEFQDSILTDLALMDIHPDRISYSSDYFEQMHDLCLRLIEDGKAYADDTDRETMQAERREGIASKRREASVSNNLTHFSEMRKGSEEGLRWCIRAKISVDDLNKALRDPVIYRCNPQPHHRTGTTWKIYPTYDFCAPVLDSLEGVTHALRTNEYRDRNPQYAWVQEALRLRKVEIWDFSRLNFIRTVLSKRKLTKLVEKGVVWGWDDPRMPTVRGIRRRGMTTEALREFMVKQGPSQNILNQDWTQFWAINKKAIDGVAPRHTAIVKQHAVEATVRGAGASPPREEEKPKHSKNPAVGTKRVVYSDRILIEQVDAQSFAPGEEITLMNWGNAFVRAITPSDDGDSIVKHLELDLYLEGDFKKTKKKITWLSTAQPLAALELADFDHLISKDKLEKDDELEDFLAPETEKRVEAWGDCNVAGLQEGDIVQFERKGYFRIDRPLREGVAAVGLEIPTGRAK
ncbi:MAG: hypothetical protein LQ342_007513 [Letrouitia transgressa]|nr:MAG: hypothetical protein LQ342_007513 [Letrouitia transgressa]